MASLFELTERLTYLTDLLDRIEEGDQDLIPQIEDYLVAHEGMLARKIDDYVYAYQELTALANARKEEAARLSEAAKRAQTRADLLKERVVKAAEALGRTKLVGETREIAISRGSMAINIMDAAAVPHEFQELIPAQYVIRKKLISDHIRATGEVPDGVQTEPIVRVIFR